MRYVYHKGEYLCVDGTHPLEVHALHYASSVFEGIRVYAGRAFMLQEHAQRLMASARLIGLNVTFDADHVCRVCTNLIATSGLKDVYVRPLIYEPDRDLTCMPPKTYAHSVLFCGNGHMSLRAANMCEGSRSLPMCRFVVLIRRPIPQRRPAQGI